MNHTKILHRLQPSGKIICQDVLHAQWRRVVEERHVVSYTDVLSRPLQKADMGKPLFKAPDGGRFEILWEKEDLTQSELQRG